jgi:phage gp36-like protein
MFITKTDLHKAIRPEELQQITRADDTIVQYGIDAALAEIRSYLVPHFQAENILSQTGTNRHALLLNFAVDMAIYIIITAAIPGQDLEDRRMRHRRATEWLQRINSGEIATDLPKAQNPDTVNTRGKTGAIVKRTNYY